MVIDIFFSRVFPRIFSRSLQTAANSLANSTQLAERAFEDVSTPARGCDASEGAHASERVCDAGEGVNARVEASRVTGLVSLCTPVRVWVRACRHGCGCSVRACGCECRCGRAGAGAGVSVRAQCGRAGAVCGQCGHVHASTVCGRGRVGTAASVRAGAQARRKLDLYIDPSNIALMS
jgi:hypothetical protein